MKLFNTLRLAFLLVVFIGSVSAANAQYISLPDSNWGKWLNGHGYSTCLTGNSTSGWQLDTTCSILPNAGIMNFHAMSIRDITGIGYFVNLTQLFCENNLLTYLPKLPPHLDLLSCSNNQLSSLPDLPSTVTDIDCRINHLTSLPALPTGLRGIDCSNNPLTSLPALPDSLRILWFEYTPITTVPVLPHYLNTLYCRQSNLSSLPELPATMSNLRVSKNPNLYCLPRVIANNLNTFYFAESGIQCFPNRFSATTYDIRPDSIQLCTPSSGCDFYYNISGNVHQYVSSDCAQDSVNGGPLFNNLKILLKRNGLVEQQFITHSSGLYSFKTDSLVTYEVQVDTTGLPIVVTCPDTGTRTVVLTPADSLHVRENFGVSCTAQDAGVLSISANRFRPLLQTLVVFKAGYTTYFNHNISCGASTPGVVTVSLSGPVHYISAYGSALTPTTVVGNTITYNINDFNSLNAGSFALLLSADSNASIGSQICITAVISPSLPDNNSGNDTLTQCFIIQNSLDPNLKEVYPTALAPNESEWLTYTIHFQNTGNDTAYLVVVRDTLSDNVLPETFQYLASSHEAVVQLFGNNMAFTFPRINLVDSMTNPALSEGWIQYKVKSKPNLPSVAQINNTAYIYFDNNPAVVTNTVTNSVMISGVSTVSGAPAISLYPNPNHGTFTLATAAGLGNHYSVYNMLGLLIAQGNITSQHESVNLSDAASGLYNLVVKGAATKQCLRIVVAR